MRLRKGRVFLVIVITVITIWGVYNIVNKNKEPKNVTVQTGEEAVYNNTINFGICNYDTLNPLTTKNKEIVNINKLIFEPLFYINSQYKLVECLAKECAKTGANTYIIIIDNSAKWSDNTSFSALDVKYTIELLKSKENIYSENVKYINTIDTINENTIKLTLSGEIPFFEYNLIFPIMSKNYYEGEDFFTSNKTPIGTGQYKIQECNENQIILEKNENYRNKDLVNKHINNININIYNEVGEIYNGFKLGNVDIVNTSSNTFKNYIGTLGYYIKAYKGREFDFISFNCENYITKEECVRQAINYAIDKEKIISSVYNNEYYKSNYPLDFGHYIYSNDYVIQDFSQENAKNILSSGGWKYSNNRWYKNGNLLTVTISVNTSNSKRCEVAKNIKEQLEDIGIVTNIREVTDAEYMNCLNNKNYQILLTGIYNGYSPDLDYFYGENNLAQYKNSTVQTLIKEVKNITDEKVLKEKYEQIIKVTTAECAYIGLYRNKCSMIVSQKMSGNFEPNNYSIFSHFETWKREK